MAVDPGADDLDPEIGSASSMKEKALLLLIGLPVFAIIVGIGSQFGSLGRIIAAGLGVGAFIGVRILIRKLRIIRFKHKRGDYEPAKEAASQAVLDTAETTGKLASGVIGLIRDAGETVAEKLEQRATQVKDSSPVAKGSEQSDIAGRLEKLSNLHEQGHISDEEFTQQRSRILDEV